MYINEVSYPEYFGKPYIEICDNIPNFNEFPKGEEYKKLGSYVRRGKEFEIYSVYICLKGTYPFKNIIQINIIS